jgi:DNA repair photolyase
MTMRTIYRPEGQAGEYAEYAANPYKGCGHECRYCWVPLFTYQKRSEFDKGANYREGFLQALAKKAATMKAKGICPQCLLCFSTDPYHGGDTMPTRETMKILAANGMGFNPLSKGGTRALRDLDLFRADRDAYAATLTSLDDDFSRNWEANAPLPRERIETLKEFYRRGIYTWVSLEPVLDIQNSLDVILATHKFVDHYKCGRANYCAAITKQTDWRGYTLELIRILRLLRKRHYIKEDLQMYLPLGYENPLRIVQHH